MYLKVAQVTQLFAGNFLEAGNSVLIRLSEVVSLLEQGTFANVLFGRGLGSTYAAVGAFWDMAVFHEATFPERELASGDLQYIHEPLVMVVKWAGIVGLALVVFGVLRGIRGSDSRRDLRILLALVFLLYFASSLQTALLVTAMYILATSSDGEPCKAP
jgi:hypothetical protein